MTFRRFFSPCARLDTEFLAKPLQGAVKQPNTRLLIGVANKNMITQQNQ